MQTNPDQHVQRTALLAALIASTLTVPAQPAPDNRNPERPAPRRPLAGGERAEGFRPGGMGGQFFPVLERVLTEAQRQSLREAMAGQREAMRGIEGKLRDARRELMQAGMIEKFDEATVRAKALALAQLEAELTVLRAKAFSQMQPALTPEQIEKVKNPPATEGGEARSEPPRRPDRRSTGARDEHDLPPKQR